jgi:TolB-like protein/Tfp pilus assembly protein PilF
MGLVSELRRRNVFRMAVLYAVAAWLIMQVAEVIIGLANLPEWIGPTILGVLAVGFPIAMIFSWFYELTPEGISLEKDVRPGDSTTHVTGRRMDFIVISMLAAAVILFAYDKWWISPPPEKSIAVLAFENMSGDPEQEYFSDGISEELLNVLAQIPELTVISRSSAFSFKGQDISIPKVAEQLNVAHVLEGSVRKMGNRVRITAQLIEARSDSHVWSETYDRKLDDIFAIQDEISAAIVGALKEKLGLQVEAVPRVIAAANSEAHEAYLRGRYLMVQRTRAGIEGAVREFNIAIAIDPDYALAHAELAIATLFSNRYSFGDLTDSEAIARATPHAERAMALDPTLAEAHAATGWLLWFQSNLEEVLTHFRQAIQINPNYAIVYNWMAILFLELGHYAEGFAAFETAVRLDPLSIPTRQNYIQQLILRNRLEEADREIEKFASIAPSRAATLQNWRTSLGGEWANELLGDLDGWRITPGQAHWRGDLSLQFAAIGLEKEALTISEPSLIVLRMLGRVGDAVALAEAHLAEDPDSPWGRYDLGMPLAGAGDYVRARPILEEWWQRSDGRISRYCCLFSAADAAALIAVYREAGEDGEVRELLAALRDDVRRLREAGMIRSFLFDSVDYEEGLAAYLSGERESGLALIAKAAEDGFFILPNEAYLQVLYDDPGFAPIRESQEARQAREREKFLAIVCIDNPYVTVWQPAEGTCEQFAAASGK